MVTAAANQSVRVNFQPLMKWRDLTRRIEDDGWYWVRTKGSHRIYRHPVKQNTVVVSPRSLGDDVSTGTEKSILKSAGVE